MNRGVYDDREERLIAGVLRAPLPPARLTTDASALWACGRHARRIATETRISLVITGAQIAGVLGVLAVVVAFVDWQALWARAGDLEPAAAAIMAFGVISTILWLALTRRFCTHS